MGRRVGVGLATVGSLGNRLAVADDHGADGDIPRIGGLSGQVQGTVHPHPVGQLCHPLLLLWGRDCARATLRRVGSTRTRAWSKAAGSALVVAVVVVLAWLLVDGLQRTGSGTGPEGAAPGTPAPEPTTRATEPVAADDPVSAPTPETSRPPSVTPPPPRPRPGDAPAPLGLVTIRDPEGDLLDAGGAPRQPPFPAADLVGVTLEGDGAALTITFALAGPPPQPADTLLWSVDLWVQGARAATIGVQQQGSRHVAGVLDWETLAQHTPPDPVEVDGAAVRVRVPLELLPMIRDRFAWEALAQVEGAYEDRAPDDGRAAFPADG